MKRYPLNKFRPSSLWAGIKTRFRPIKLWAGCCKLIFGNIPFSTAVSRAKFKKAFEKFRQEGDVSAPLAPVELDLLKDNGFVCIPETNRKITLRDEVASRLEKYLDAKHEYSHGSKKYLRNLAPESISESDRELMYRFLSQEFFLDLAAKYLGEFPLLVEMKILISPPTDESGFSGSQLWHSDYDDEKNLKIFHFLRDVDMETGPLQALNRQTSQEIIDARGYVWGSSISHDDCLVNDGEQDFEIYTGRAGDTVLLDTVNCLHRGSRSARKTRYILYGTYNTRSPFRFPPYHKLLPFRYNGLNEFTVPLIRFDPEMKFLGKVAINI